MFPLAKFSAITSVTVKHNSHYWTSLGHLVWSDTNWNDPICVVSPKYSLCKYNRVSLFLALSLTKVANISKASSEICWEPLNSNRATYFQTSVASAAAKEPPTGPSFILVFAPDLSNTSTKNVFCSGFDIRKRNFANSAITDFPSHPVRIWPLCYPPFAFT